MNGWEFLFFVSMLLTLVLLFTTIIIFIFKRSLALYFLYGTIGSAALFIISLSGQNDIFLVFMLLSVFAAFLCIVAGIVLTIKKNNKAIKAWIGSGVSVLMVIISIALAVYFDPAPTASTEVAATKESVKDATEEEQSDAKKEEAATLAATEKKQMEETRQKDIEKKKKEQQEREKQAKEEKERKEKEAIAKKEAEKKEQEKVAKEKAEKEKAERKVQAEAEKKEQEEQKSLEQKAYAEFASRPTLDMHVNSFPLLWSAFAESMKGGNVAPFENLDWVEEGKLLKGQMYDHLSTSVYVNPSNKNVIAIVLESDMPEEANDIVYKRFVSATYGMMLISIPKDQSREEAERDLDSTFQRLYTGIETMTDIRQGNKSVTQGDVTYILTTTNGKLQFYVVSEEFFNS